MTRGLTVTTAKMGVRTRERDIDNDTAAPTATAEARTAPCVRKQPRVSILI